MSVRRVIAIGFVFLAACGGWFILGTRMVVRSDGFSRLLGKQVEGLWGEPLVQKAPSLGVQIPGSDKVRWLMPTRNDIDVELNTDYRKKGLIWYPTYTCFFDGTYTITNREDVAQKVRIHFDFPAAGGTYDKFSMTIDGDTVMAPINTHEGIDEIIELASGESRQFQITYETRGIRDWRYQIDPNVGRVQGLSLKVTTGFHDIDYTEGSRSPTSAEPVGKEMVLKWEATDLITAEDMGVIIPEKLNPGPLTSRITFFAPVCLIFFFVLVATINIMYKINIHPMHYLFVAAGFFAFHLLLAYMVDVVNIHASFAVSAVVSVVLVTCYLRAALGAGFPWKAAVAGQVFFLVLFSYSFFLDGTTGLTVAIGSIVTLAVLMKVTAHVDWEKVFTGPKKPKPTSPPPVPQGAQTAP